MPRSPNRDLLDPHDGDRGYFRRPNWVTRFKLAFSVVGAALVVAWASVEAIRPARTATAHSPGALASPHSAWEADCAACHVGFSASDFGPRSLFQAGRRWHALTCEKCHAGPAHHSAVDAEGAEFHARCANCHRDHDGAMKSLARVADDRCVRCHANLPAHSANGTEIHPTVTAFARDHPEFRLLNAQAGKASFEARTLKFSHALHMTPGLIYREGAKTAWTLNQLAELSGPEVARRYQKQGDAPNAPVRLECASCHSTDTSGTRGPHGDGAYYQPVSFEAHCKSCHPARAPAGTSGTVVVPAFDLPHGLQPAELGTKLAGEYARHLLDDHNRFAATPLGPTGRFDPRSNPTVVTFKNEIQRLEGIATETLFSPAPPPEVPAVPARGAACTKCHEFISRPGQVSPKIAPMAAPAVWFTGGKFNHASHRAVACLSCHPGTGAAFFGTGWTTEKEPVRIAGVASCQQCHGPRRSVAGSGGAGFDAGGARHACTDCHSYHNGDHAQRGPRVALRNPAQRFDANEFLQTPKR